MIKISHWCTELPGAFFYIQSPSFLTFVVYYGLLVGVLSGWLLARQRRAWVAAGAVLLGALYGWQWHKARSEFELTVLPLNGGHSVFVNGVGGQNDWLIDCGNTNAVEFVMKPFLRAQGVNRLPRLLLTHGDLQHIGGTEPVNELFGVGEIFTSSVRFRSPTYRQIIVNLEHAPHRHKTINRRDDVSVWSVLHPDPAQKFPQADDSALVLLGKFHQMRILLLSDLGRPGQESLLASGQDLRADVVIAGLPEQSEPVCDALLDAIQPRVIIIADSEFPATKRADPKLRERLETRHTSVIYTRTVGAVTIRIGPERWELQSSDGHKLFVP
jgi:competence protein ComEC